VSKANLKLLGLGLLWIGGAFVLLALSESVSPWLLPAILLLMITVAALSYRVRCHGCRWPLIKRGLFVVPYAPRSCPNCGEKVA